MVDSGNTIDPKYRVEMDSPLFNVPALDVYNMTPMELVLGESLLTPGLQTTIRMHNSIHDVNNGSGMGPIQVKNLDNFYGSTVLLRIYRELNKKFGISDEMFVNQIVYRIDKRHLYNNNTEEFLIHGCDPTLLIDAAALVSKLWKCSTPSAVAREVLSQCAGARNLQIEESYPARPYSADNIHPFQVVYQQSNAALAGGNDPSFVHFMTYIINSGEGRHHFESLKGMCSRPPINQNDPFTFSEISNSFTGPPYGIMNYSFPCDFDMVTDLLNGPGSDTGSTIVINPINSTMSLLGNQTVGCGIGAGPLKVTFSNAGSSSIQNMCEDYTQIYLQKRQARMRLIDPNHIALRMIVPWNPDLHAGKVIRIVLKNKKEPIIQNYGSGDYLIVSMKHSIKYGGYGTTTVDCVSTSVGLAARV